MSPNRQSGGFDLGDYNEVNERIIEFRAKYPEGCLQQLSLDFREVNDGWWVIYTAAAYRTPDDQRPGHGTAWEPVPGTTPYTRNSEVQNAETAAWGRALIAVGAADAKKGIASADEVRARRTEPEPEPTPHQIKVTQAIAKLSDDDKASLKAWWPEDLPKVNRLNQSQAASVMAQIATYQGKEEAPASTEVHTTIEEKENGTGGDHTPPSPESLEEARRVANLGRIHEAKEQLGAKS